MQPKCGVKTEKSSKNELPGVFAKRKRSYNFQPGFGVFDSFGSELARTRWSFFTEYFIFPKYLIRARAHYNKSILHKKQFHSTHMSAYNKVSSPPFSLRLLKNLGRLTHRDTPPYYTVLCQHFAHHTFAWWSPARDHYNKCNYESVKIIIFRRMSHGWYFESGLVVGDSLDRLLCIPL